MNRTLSLHRAPGALLPPLIAGVLLLAGCASTPPAPTEQIAAAHQAIANAAQADAGRYAAGEIGEARSKLVQADAEVANQHMVAARRLAVESHTEADLATAITTERKAKAVNAELQRGNDALAQEMQRNSGTNP
ncbi:MAG TPA: DUF4398 domain-containing protein [Steroidobacteraceae bacterium]|nr:DUF4398 domain-containing protein [Steroidobacteraceae bacterium]